MRSTAVGITERGFALRNLVGVIAENSRKIARSRLWTNAALYIDCITVLQCVPDELSPHGMIHFIGLSVS